MTLAGLAPKTQTLYVEAVRSLAKFYMKSPDTISEKEIRDYLIHVREVDHAAEGTLRILHFGLKFFFQKSLQRDWPVLKLMRLPKKKRLPTVLSPSEVKEILRHIRVPRNQMCLTLIYACGLRISEATHIRVSDIDGERRLVKVLGKGSKERLVPLPEPVLEQLRRYWMLQRPKNWLFPGKNTEEPVSNHTVRNALKAAAGECGIKKAVIPHSLRHSYATHLMENKIDIRVIQLMLGHSSPRTTSIYTHLTPQTLENVQKTINHLTQNL